MRKPKTVGEIVQDIRAAVERMSVNNSHRRVLIDAERALTSMAKRLAPVEVEAGQ